MKDLIVAGDTLDFETDVQEFPASDGWTLKYRLVPQFTTPVQAPITLTAAAYLITRYRVQEGPTTTAAWTPGEYARFAWVEKGGARHELGPPFNGLTKIKQDPATAAQGFDNRTHARRALDAIEAVLENRATLDQEEYAINGRSLKRTPLKELLALRQRYAAEVAGEDADELLAAGAAKPRKVQVCL